MDNHEVEAKGIGLSHNHDVISSSDSSSPPSPSAAFMIDPAKEAHLMTLFDLLVLPMIALLNILAQLDRSNIGNAKQFGFEAGLGLVGDQFNDISSIFYATYVLFEIPWVILLKRFGANRVLGVAMLGWSAVTLGTGFLHNYGQLIALRLCLGVFEAGLFPCCAFFITTIYPPRYQAKRISVLYAATAASGAFGGLIAYGIQSLGTRAGLAAWRWLFIAEGIMSLGVSCLVLFMVPRRAGQAWFLSGEQKALLAAIEERDRLYNGASEGLEGEISWANMRLALTDPFIYLAGFSLFCSSIPLFGFSTFLPTIIKGLGYTSLQANYLTIPVYVWGVVALYAFTYTSDRLNKRYAVVWLCPLFVITGYAIAVGTDNHAAGYFAMFLVVTGLYSNNTLIVTWVSNNLRPDTKRDIGIPLLVCLANLSGLVASYIYLSKDSPRYVMGNAVSMATEVVAWLAAGSMYLLLRRRNAQKDAIVAEGRSVKPEFGQSDRGIDFRYVL